MCGELTVDLASPPERRWRLSDEQLRHTRELIEVYLRDLGLDADFLDALEASAKSVVPPDYFEELLALAKTVNVAPKQILASNLYYDALKLVWGCTAFAVETEAGPIHARNLDWGTENRLLNVTTLVTRFTNAPAGDFLTVGWPGFVGALSGVAPGRFAVTLNAVLSDDAPAVATPVVFLLRQVLETAVTFDEAVGRLRSTPIASDCLLLVSGPRESEMVVIERTPTRHAVRHASDGAIFVTNDYLTLDADSSAATGQLHATSCGRREKICSLVHGRRPSGFAECLDYLADPDVRMPITVQQMAFDPRTGEHLLRIP